MTQQSPEKTIAQSRKEILEHLKVLRGQKVAEDIHSDQARVNLQTLGQVANGSLVLLATAHASGQAKHWSFDAPNGYFIYERPGAVQRRGGVTHYHQMMVNRTSTRAVGYIKILRAEVHAGLHTPTYLRSTGVPDPSSPASPDVVLYRSARHDLYYDSDKIADSLLPHLRTEEEIYAAEAETATAMPFYTAQEHSRRLPEFPDRPDVPRTPFGLYYAGASLLVANFAQLVLDTTPNPSLPPHSHIKTII